MTWSYPHFAHGYKGVYGLRQPVWCAIRYQVYYSSLSVQELTEAWYST